MIEYFPKPGRDSLFLAPRKFQVLRKMMYAISPYRYDVYLRRQWGANGDFCPGDLAISGILFFAIVFAFWAQLLYYFLPSQQFWTLEEVCSHRDGFPLAVNGRWVRSRSRVPGTIVGSSLSLLSCKEPVRVLVGTLQL